MKFPILAKIPIMSFWGINKALHSDDMKEKRKIFGLAIILVFACFSFCSTFVSTAIGYDACGLAERIPAVIFSSCSSISLLVAIFRTNGFLFSSKDYDMLMSMPVSVFDVVLSKVAVIYFTCLLFTLPVTVSGDFIYLMSDKASAPGIISVIAAVFLTPMLPITLGLLIGFVISLISSKIKHKNIISTALLFIVLIVILAFPYVSEKLFGISDSTSLNSPEVAALLSNTSDMIEASYFPAKMLTLSVCGNPLMLLAFIVVNAAAIVIVSAVISHFYKSINTKLSSNTLTANYKLGKVAKSSQFTALYGKDLRRFLSSSTFMVNMGFGAIIIVVLCAVTLFISPEEILKSAEIGINVNQLCDAVPFIISAILSTCIIAAPLISLEGKSLWIMKSSPINFETVYLAKEAVQLTVTLSVEIISCIVLCFTLPLSPIQTVFLFVIPTVMNILSAEIGITVGLHFANYEWTNEVTVIKQSAATGICMITNIVLSVIPCVLCFAIGSQPFTAIYSVLSLIAVFVIHGINKHKIP